MGGDPGNSGDERGIIQCIVSLFVYLYTPIQLTRADTWVFTSCAQNQVPLATVATPTHGISLAINRLAKIESVETGNHHISLKS